MKEREEYLEKVIGTYRKVLAACRGSYKISESALDIINDYWKGKNKERCPGTYYRPHAVFRCGQEKGHSGLHKTGWLDDGTHLCVKHPTIAVNHCGCNY